MKRRSFLMVSLGSLSAFALVKSKQFKPYDKKLQVMLAVMYELFPESKIAPSARDLHMSSYMVYVLNDTRLMPSERRYLLKGATWIEEEAFELFSRSFLELKPKEKELLLERVARYEWGESVIYSYVNYIFEALICAPVYGSNVNEAGWKWLGHNPGFPQPQSIEDITYEV